MDDHPYKSQIYFMYKKVKTFKNFRKFKLHTKKKLENK